MCASQIRGLPIIIVWLILSACATTPKAPPAQAEPHLIGSIIMVNEPLKFALIDLHSAYSPGMGKALKSFSEGVESGILSVSPEKKRSFIIADIVQGVPRKGDKVFE